MTDSERYVEITNHLNEAGTLSRGEADLTGPIGDAVVIAWEKALRAAQQEGREIVAAS